MVARDPFGGPFYNAFKTLLKQCFKGIFITAGPADNKMGAAIPGLAGQQGQRRTINHIFEHRKEKQHGIGMAETDPR